MLRTDLDEELEILHELQANPLLTRYSQQIREYRSRLGQDDTSLSQIEDRLEEIPFGPMLSDIRGRLDQWGQLKVEILQSQNAMVDAWLQQRPQLIPLKDLILQNLDNVAMPVSRIIHQMMEAGSDPVLQLIEGETRDVLALFAAAQLLDALGRGEVQ